MQFAGLYKKSFELNYNGGTIWCEHLDGMGTCEDEVITKFTGDRSRFSKPSVSSYMIINLDETVITDKIAKIIVSGIIAADKPIRKIAFVGVDKRWRQTLDFIKVKGISTSFLSDYEKAKEWLFSGN